jgi:phospholipase C
MPLTRRDFIKQAALLSAAGAMGGFAETIRRARAIEPAKGTTFLDAKHVVILMQENRSFDHAFGTLRGVRGFNDPRAIRLPDGSPVWAQPAKDASRFLPFRLNIKDSKSTWMGSLPHGWADQVDARNGGRYDRWVQVKHSGHSEYAHMPLTMGYYTREDIPFYYALADAFTVCDQNFCSSLTGTTPNRLHLWTGTIRPKQSPDAPAYVYNEDTDPKWHNWPTFPERLEDLGVSWRIYQNELTIDSGFDSEENAWLSNFGDSPIERFTQYGVRFAKTHRDYVSRKLPELPAEIDAAEKALAGATGTERQPLQRRLRRLREQLAQFQTEQAEFSDERRKALTDRERRLHERAFCTNADQPDSRKLTELAYSDNGAERRVPVPKGDILHNFRKDVAEGTLPTVSWLVPPERVSDHPGSAWYGAWYLSEVLNILTQNPRVWQETVFILTYDENDGYFDHVPPFVAPDPRKPETGRVSGGIDAAMEWVTLESDRALHGDGARESSIGLGYRVPMIIASPWSRGGYVCSQVSDHTSVIQFLEKLLSHRLGRKVEEPNINRWRRAVCGDLTSAFSTSDDSSASLKPLDRDEFVEQIHKAQFGKLPDGFHALTEAEIEQLRRDPAGSPLMPRQEKGLRPSRALPYELFVTDSRGAGRDGAGSDELKLRFEARKDRFGDRAAGAPFTVYSHGPAFSCRHYAVEPGEAVEDAWRLADLEDGRYHLSAYGPNGFLREFIGGPSDPHVSVEMLPPRAGVQPGDAEVQIRAARDFGAEAAFVIRDHAYGNPEQQVRVEAGAIVSARVPVRASHGWYDFSVMADGKTPFERRFAGRVESGVDGFSDPLLSGPA